MNSRFVKAISGVCSLLAIISNVLAQDSTTTSKIDSMLMYQQQVLDQQADIYDEVVRYKEPLADRVFGLEINPFYVLSSALNEDIIVSGGVSLFAITRKAELAFPFYYHHADEAAFDDEFTKFNQDFIYRRFMGQHQNGFYLETGLRYTHLKGVESYNLIDFINSGDANIISIDKGGMLFGIGYRYFSNSRLYWGTSLAIGMYFTSDKRKLVSALLSDSKYILDFELMKFGYTF